MMLKYSYKFVVYLLLLVYLFVNGIYILIVNYLLLVCCCFLNPNISKIYANYSQRLWANIKINKVNQNCHNYDRIRKFT